MNFELIFATYFPIILAVCSEVGVILAMISKVKGFFDKTNSAVDELKESAEYKELKVQLKSVIQENVKLKQQMRVLMEKLTHVKVVENDEPEDKIN